MPCTLTGSLEGDRAASSQATVTTLTQLLCGACQLLEQNGIEMSDVKTEGVRDWAAPQTLSGWWDHHKVVDATPPRFDPRQHRWQFESYYKYMFTYRCVEEPAWTVDYGGDRDQIYRHSVENGHTTWHDATGGAADQEDDLNVIFDGVHDYIRLTEHL